MYRDQQVSGLHLADANDNWLCAMPYFQARKKVVVDSENVGWADELFISDSIFVCKRELGQAAQSSC